MTIAAAFCFDGGILLCADSQLTYGGVCKTKGQKVLSYDLHPTPVKIGFALAGDVHRAKHGIMHIARTVDALGTAATGSTVIDAIREAQQEAYQRVFKHPRFLRGDGPDYSLLICLWIESEGPGLFVTNEDVVTPVDDFDCKGSGYYLFRYLLQSMYKPDLSLQKIVVLAAHAFDEIKTYDPQVGFNSEFLVFRKEVQEFSHIAGYDIGHVENFGRLLQRSMYQLLFVMADLTESDEAIARARQLFQDNLTNLRQRYDEDKRHRNAIITLLRYLQEPGPKTIHLKFNAPGRK